MVVTPISTGLMRIKLMINMKKLQLLLYPLQTQAYQNRWEKRHFADCKFSCVSSGRGYQMQLASGSRPWGAEVGRGEACSSPLVRPQGGLCSLQACHLQTRLRSQQGLARGWRGAAVRLGEPCLSLEEGSCAGPASCLHCSMTW